MSEKDKLANAQGLYMEGIRDGNAREALDKYIGDRYTQHSTGVADGKEGFLKFFTPFLKRNPVRDITVVRSFVDGNQVFAHVFQNLNDGAAKWVTADFFDTDSDDKIVEHWDTIQEFRENTASGRSMIDGPTAVIDLDKTEANRTLVSNFMNAVLVGGAFDRMSDFISAEQYHQHSPDVPDGIAGAGTYFAEQAKKGAAYTYEKVNKLLVQGNFAAALSAAKIGSDDYAIIDIFRVENGKIVEHWDVTEKISPKENWNNSGKF